MDGWTVYEVVGRLTDGSFQRKRQHNDEVPADRDEARDARRHAENHDPRRRTGVSRRPVQIRRRVFRRHPRPADITVVDRPTEEAALSQRRRRVVGTCRSWQHCQSELGIRRINNNNNCAPEQLASNTRVFQD